MAKGRFASSGVVVGQTPASQWEKRLQHQKSNKVTMGVGLPQQTEGAVGDITVREISSEGLRCYIKTNSGWLDINTMQSADKTKWTDMILANNWEPASAYGTPQYFKDTNGFVHFRGGVDDSGASAPASYNNTIATLSEGFRPAKTIYRYVNRDGDLDNIQAVQVTAAGVVNANAQRTLTIGGNIVWGSAAEDELNYDTSKDIYLEGVSFFAGQDIRGSGGGDSSGGGGAGSSGGGGGA